MGRPSLEFMKFGFYVAVPIAGVYMFYHPKLMSQMIQKFSFVKQQPLEPIPKNLPPVAVAVKSKDKPIPQISPTQQQQ